MSEEVEEFQEVAERLREAVRYGPPQYSSLFQEALDRIQWLEAMRDERFVEIKRAQRIIDRMRLRADALEAALDQAIGYLEHFTSQPDYSEEAEQHAIIVDGDIERFKALVVEGK